MHHGTILFDSDPAIIGNALQVDREKLASKGVKSVVSRVTNLRAHLPEGTTLADFKARLVEELGKSEVMEPMELSKEALARIEEIKREYDKGDEAQLKTREDYLAWCRVQIAIKEGEVL
jgi:lipoate-protein ligase A